MRLILDMINAWGGLRASMSRQIAANPREAKLLAYAMLAGVLGFVARVPGALLQDRQSDDFAPILWSLFVSGVFFAPLFFYLIAALSALALRFLGRKVAYRDMRLALFWALLVSTPILFATTLAALPLAQAGGGILQVVRIAGLLFFAYVWWCMVTVVVARKYRSD